VPGGKDHMNLKSRYDEGDAPKEPKKKYYFVGYGNPGYGGATRRGGYSGNALWDLHMFDVVLEKLGIKKKAPRRRSEGEE
jgi:hypothetical protein